MQRLIEKLFAENDTSAEGSLVEDLADIQIVWQDFGHYDRMIKAEQDFSRNFTSTEGSPFLGRVDASAGGFVWVADGEEETKLEVVGMSGELAYVKPGAWIVPDLACCLRLILILRNWSFNRSTSAFLCFAEKPAIQKKNGFEMN